MRGSCVPRRGVLARRALPVMSLARNPEGARELSVSRQMRQRYAGEQAAKRKKAEADAAVSRVPSVDSRVADASVEAWRTFKLYLGMLTREDVTKIIGWLIAAYLALNAMECASCVACGIPWSMKDTELMLPFLRMSIKLAVNHMLPEQNETSAGAPLPPVRGNSVKRYRAIQHLPCSPSSICPSSSLRVDCSGCERAVHAARGWHLDPHVRRHRPRHLEQERAVRHRGGGAARLCVRVLAVMMMDR